MGRVASDPPLILYDRVTEATPALSGRPGLQSRTVAVTSRGPVEIVWESLSNEMISGGRSPVTLMTIHHIQFAPARDIACDRDMCSLLLNCHEYRIILPNGRFDKSVPQYDRVRRVDSEQM